MTHKYERQCWNCGSKDMEKLANHVRCRSCGATWNVVPELHKIPVINEVIINITPGGPIKVLGGRPSGNVAGRAARARDKASCK